MKLYFFALATVLTLPSLLLAQGGAGNAGQGGTSNAGQGGTQNPGGDFSLGEPVGPPAGSVTIRNPLGDNATITSFFLDLLQVLLIFAVPIIVFFIIFAGFQYVTARGNVEQIQKATRALTYAIIGGLLILGAQVILSVIQGTVNEFLR